MEMADVVVNKWGSQKNQTPFVLPVPDLHLRL